MTPDADARTRRRQPATIALLLVLNVAVVLAPLRAMLRLPVAPQDEGLLLTYPDVFLRGGVPNLDFESVYGPTWIWAMATAFVAFGHSLLVERLVGIGYRVLVMVGVYLLVRPQGPRTALISAALSGVVAQLAFGAAALALFGATGFGLLALAAGLAARARHDGRLALAAGLAAGLALGYRPDFVVALGAGALVVCFAWRRQEVRAALLGFAVGLVPVWVNLVRAGPGRVLQGSILDPLLVLPEGRKLPFSTMETDVQLAAIATAVLAAAACLVAWRSLRRGAERDRSLLSLALVALALTPYMSSRWDPPHVALVVMTSIALVPPMLSRALRGRTAGPWPVRLALAGLSTATALACVSAFGGSYRGLVRDSVQPVPSYVVTNDDREVIVGTATDQANLEGLVRDLRRVSTGAASRRLAVLPGDPAVTFYNDTFLYFLLPGFTPSTYYLEMEPGVANAPESRLAEELTRTDFVITNDRHNTTGEPNTAGDRGDTRAAEALRRDFREVSHRGPWRLLVRR